ncbi:transposase [Streptomyces noursei ATCC 11455]|nr:transposase [Streptomyces noursei ATCC 11455]
MRVFLEADAPRVGCHIHGSVVAWVPWARHGAGHTLAFDQQAAWMAAECSKTATAALMRISWRTAGAIVARFVADRDRDVDRLAGLRRIGIDEISHRRGQKYMTVVVCHDTGRVVWMADGHGKHVLHRFFDGLGPGRTGRLIDISADGAGWIAGVLAERAPHARRVMDPFHVVAWATTALDAERRTAWNRARPALYKAAANGLPTLADKGYIGAGIGILIPVRRPKGKSEQALHVDTRVFNTLLRHVRALGERTAAELKQRWRALQRVTLSPSRIGDIARAALVLNGIWK